MNTLAKMMKMLIIATMPYCEGISRRASMMERMNVIPCDDIRSANFQVKPLITFSLSEEFDIIQSCIS